MKESLFYSKSYIVKNLGFGFDFSKPYYINSVSSKHARFSVSISRLLPVLAVRSAICLIVKVVRRLTGIFFDAFRIVIFSTVI